jgi:hypothetical protein
LFAWNILGNGDTMQTTVPFQTEKILEADSLLLTSGILVGVYRTIRDVQALAAALLHYAMIGASIADCLMDLMGSTMPEEV